MKLAYFGIVLAASLSMQMAAVGAPATTMLIENAMIADGSGSDMFPGDVRVRDGNIVAVGTLAALPGEQVQVKTGRSSGMQPPSTHLRPLEHVPLAAFRRQLEVNVVGTLAGERVFRALSDGPVRVTVRHGLALLCGATARAADKGTPVTVTPGSHGERRKPAWRRACR